MMERVRRERREQEKKQEPCFHNCPYTKYFDFPSKGLLTFQEWFKASIEGAIKRDGEIEELKRENARLQCALRKMAQRKG